MKVTFIPLLLVSQLWLTLAELYTAISDMEKVLKETQRRVIDDLESYVLREQERIGKLKRSLEIYKKEHEVATADVPNYLGNPVTAFRLINQLTTDLTHIENGINKSAEYIRSISTNPDMYFPTREDILGAAAAVVRVQKTYNLNITDLADWKHNGIGTAMSAGECFELARALYQMEDYNSSLAWMTEALRKYDVDGDIYITATDIMESIAYTNYILHNTEAAIEWTETILKSNPNNSRALEYLELFHSTPAKDLIIQSDGYDYGLYDTLCRGDLTVAESVSKSLRCSYLTGNHPFLRLAPIKREQVYAKPDIFVFHEVLSDDEIKQIQEMAKPKFKRATVVDTAGSASFISNPLISTYRTGKTAFIENEVDLMRLLEQRVTDMTGFDMRSSEQLQVVDYGIGGHYGPHHDCAIGPKRHTAFGNGLGNRIATVLFYMTTVARGGATVFTELGLSVAPVKGSAVFWLNLNPSGEGDLAMQHASCPVLTGSKWVCTKWLHESGQELIRPCGLQYQEEGIPWNLTAPVPVTSRYLI